MFRAVNKQLTGFSGLVKLAGSLYDHVAHRTDQSQPGSGLERAVGSAVYAVGQCLQITSVGGLCGHCQRYDAVTWNNQINIDLNKWKLSKPLYCIFPLSYWSMFGSCVWCTDDDNAKVPTWLRRIFYETIIIVFSFKFLILPMTIDRRIRFVLRSLFSKYFGPRNFQQRVRLNYTCWIKKGWTLQNLNFLLNVDFVLMNF